MSGLLGFIFGMLAVVGAFGFIIFIHELGHFITARAVDIRCPQFAIGFGPSLFSFRWQGTNFAVRAFPLGGYVLMNGEEPGDRKEDPWADSVRRYLGEVDFPATPGQLLEVLDRTPQSERAQTWQDVRDQVAYARCKEFPTLQSVEGNFHDRSIRARILVISGGVLMNFLATILLLWAIGPVAGVGAFFRDWSPTISQAVSGAPASEAGVSGGDRILEVDGQATATYLESYYAIGEFQGEAFQLKVEKRGGGEQTYTIRPLLLVGEQTYEVDDNGELTLQSAPQEEWVGKKVVSPDREALIASVRRESPLEEGEEASYSVTFEGEKQATKFELPQGFEHARGQVGVLFGVSDIVFEKELTGRVRSVAAGSPAEKAGLKVGDDIQLVNSLALYSPSTGMVYGSLVEPAMEAVARVEEVPELKFLVLREGEPETITFQEKATNLEELGVTLEPLTGRDLLKAPFHMIGQTLALPYRILSMWLSREKSGTEIVSSMQGPIGIMQLLYELSDNGLLQFLYFMALLNAAIGAFNLLPFPALDGARLVFLVIAAVRGRQIDPDKEAKVHLLGLMVLLCFVVVVTVGDIRRLLSAQLFVM